MTNVKISVSTKDMKFENHQLETVNFSEEKPYHASNLSALLNIHQLGHTILGIGYSFEHTSCYNLLQLSTEDHRKALELLVDPIKGAGMNLWRICIGTSDFTGTPWYSYCDKSPVKETPSDTDLIKHIEDNFSIAEDKKLIFPILKEALAINPNLIFYASPWSPPGWMKDTNNMCSGHLIPLYRECYAYYLMKFVKAYEQEGIKIHAITVQNEPLHNVKSMPTCLWDLKGTQERDFIRDFLGPTFEKFGLTTEIWAYDHNWTDLPSRPAVYPQTIMKDPNAAKYVKGIAFHHYAVGGWGNPKTQLKLRQLMPSVPFYFSEGSLFGLWGALRLTRYLKYGSSSYSGWVPMLDTEGKPNNGPFKGAHRSIIQRKVPENELIVNFDYYMYLQFSKYIHTGAKLINSSINKKRGYEFIAFLNPDNSIVSVITNKANKARNINVEWNKKYIVVELLKNSITTLQWNI
jgi:O-glycosyl hydrolase